MRKAKDYIPLWIKEEADNNGKYITEKMAEHAYAKLMVFERELHKLAQNCVNLPSYDEERQNELEDRAEEMVRVYTGCEVHTQRDPRGSMIRIHPTMKEHVNSFDGETMVLED